MYKRQILYWIFFVLLLYIYGKVLFPLFQNILTIISQPDLAEGISFVLIFSLSVITLAKFLKGDFHTFFYNLFSNKGFSTNNEDNIKEVKETRPKISSEKGVVDKYYKTKTNEGLIKDEGGGYFIKFLNLFLIIFFSLIFWVMLTA